jgi:hypothetical protein
MLILAIHRAELEEVRPDGIERLTKLAADQYQAILRPAAELQASHLGLDVEGLRATPEPDRYSARRYEIDQAEIYTDKKRAFAVVVETESRPRKRVRRLDDGTTVSVEDLSSILWVYALLPEPDDALVEDFAGLAGNAFGVKTTRFYYSSGRFDALLQEGIEPAPVPTAREMDGATLLADREVRRIAIAIASSGGLLVGDLAKQLPEDARARTTEIDEALRNGGLVETEVFVHCKKTSTQAGRAPSMEVLEQWAEAGLKCGCGRKITDERVEEALTLTNDARQLLESSRWMSVLLHKELRDLGVQPAHIAIEQKTGEDELDCLAVVSGELVLFELKDKEFSLGDAYSFGAKIGIIEPEHPVIVTTERVGNDARDHFTRAGVGGPRRRENVYFEASGEEHIRYVEGLENLTAGLRELVSQIHSRDAASILRPVLTLGSISASGLVEGVGRNPEVVLDLGTQAEAVEVSTLQPEG